MLDERETILVYGMTDNPGGIETYLLYLMNNMKTLKFDFVTDFHAVAYETEIKESGAKIHYIPAKSKGLFKQWLCFINILKKNPQYHTVYFNILNAGSALTMVIPWLMRKKIVIHSHNASADNIWLHRVFRPLLNIMGDKFLACSNLAGEFMFGKAIIKKNKLVTIPNAIDSQKFDYSQETRNMVRKELEIEDKFVLCHVGRIVAQKNPKGVIDILDECVRVDKSCVLLYVGTGDMDKDIKRYVSEKGLSSYVRFLGVRDDVYNLMQAADCFILPSFYEGLPIVAIEAQAAGLPCFLSSNISPETKITDLVTFLQLSNVKEWRDCIVSSKNFNRKSVRNLIVEAGYDIGHQRRNLLKLDEILR